MNEVVFTSEIPDRCVSELFLTLEIDYDIGMILIPCWISVIIKHYVRKSF